MNGTKSSVVHEYTLPSRGNTSTFTVDNKTQISFLKNGVSRPKGHTVSWHSNPEVEKNHFGLNHPMKPWRLTLTKQLVMGYGMHEAMDNYRARQATPEELMSFHSPEYIKFLSRVLPTDEVTDEYLDLSDCPIFDGLYKHCSLYAGASLDAARKLNNNQSDIAINWSGGLHHAKKSRASGFCYINDIVIAILELLRFHPRVLYIDIDVHHGDGVEQAFWSTNRVMTLSFHKYDGVTFFPGTGALDATGPTNPNNPGAHHSLNVPLHDGIVDKQYNALFEDIVGNTVKAYNPTVIVLQCGADSLGGDRLGCFNLNITGHGQCVQFVKSLDRPILLLGGGGYTPRNVARLWTHETAIALDVDLDDALPAHTPSMNSFPDRKLLPPLDGGSTRKDNLNDQEHLDTIRMGIYKQLRYLANAPSVELHEIPDGMGKWMDQLEDEEKDEREANDEKLRMARERGAGAIGEYVE
ncbi:MAG: histone deacetylase [Vezdaea acicularis]|nr:MAG: histone deacetylase [Vezdaea acicularis]